MLLVCIEANMFPAVNQPTLRTKRNTITISIELPESGKRSNSEEQKDAEESAKL